MIRILSTKNIDSDKYFFHFKSHHHVANRIFVSNNFPFHILSLFCIFKVKHYFQIIKKLIGTFNYNNTLLK